MRATCAILLTRSRDRHDFGTLRELSECRGERLIAVFGGVLIAERGPWIGMSTTAHQLGNARTAGRCPREPAVPEVVLKPMSA